MDSQTQIQYLRQCLRNAEADLKHAKSTLKRIAERDGNALLRSAGMLHIIAFRGEGMTEYVRERVLEVSKYLYDAFEESERLREAGLEPVKQELQELQA